jgi:uncharacterized protein (TIGR02246 family)
MNSIVSIKGVGVNRPTAKPRHGNCVHESSLRILSTTGRTTMNRPHLKISLSRIMLLWASGGLAASASAQVPATVRTESVPAVSQTASSAPEGPAGEMLTNRPEDEKAIKRVTDEFARAFNAGDAKAVAALYTDDAEVIDEYGERIQGRPTIQDFYSALFNERKGATIEISMVALHFLGPDVAKEDGRTRVKSTAGEPATYRDYTVVYVKQGGRWLHSSVHEKHPTGLAHHERLKELEWILGEWLDESSDSIIHATCRWSDDKNFLLRDFVIHVQGKPVMNVTQRIGWDPLTRQIKSWVFDSDGGYGDAFWARNGNQWIIKSTGVLPDGRIATGTNILTRTGPNVARWISTERTVGGEVAPDHHESVMVRRPPAPQSQPLPR